MDADVNDARLPRLRIDENGTLLTRGPEVSTGSLWPADTALVGRDDRLCCRRRPEDSTARIGIPYLSTGKSLSSCCKYDLGGGRSKETDRFGPRLSCSSLSELDFGVRAERMGIPNLSSGADFKIDGSTGDGMQLGIEDRRSLRLLVFLVLEAGCGIGIPNLSTVAGADWVECEVSLSDVDRGFTS